MNTSLTPAPISRWWMLATIAVCCALAWLLYADALQFQYVWDDSIIRARRNYAYLDDVFHEAFLRQFLIPAYYRPLPVLTMILETRAGATAELQSHYGHLINLLAFTLAMTLLALILFRLLQRHWPAGAGIGWQRWLATGTVLVFAVHPAVLVGNAWVSARFDLFVTLFALLLVWLDLAVRPPLVRGIAVGAAFLLAAFSKEMTVTLALFLPLWHLFLGWHQRAPGTGWFLWARERGHWHSYIGILLAGLVYLGLRYNALDHQLLPELPARAIGSNGLEKLLYVGKTVYWYALLELWPFVRIAPSYFQMVPVSRDDLAALAGVAALFVLPVAGLLAALKGRRIGWLLLAFVAVNLPIINIQPLAIQDNIVDLRMAYLPAALLLLMLGDGLFSLARHGSLLRDGSVALKAAVTTGAVWLLFGAISAVLVLPVWQNNLTFWTWYRVSSIPTASSSLSYCSALLEFKRYPEADTCFGEFIQTYPANALGAHYNRALLYNETGQYPAALADLQHVLQSMDTGEKTTFYKINALYLTAESLLGMHDYPKTIAMIDKALQQASAPHGTMIDQLNWNLLLVRYGLEAHDPTAVQRGLSAAMQLSHGSRQQLQQRLRDHNLPDALADTAGNAPEPSVSAERSPEHPPTAQQK